MKKRTKDLLMLLSFLGVAAFTYVFHIIQAQQTLRTYFTAITLLVAYALAGPKTKTVPKIQTCWAIFFAWVVQSSIYYQPGTHVHGYIRFIKHIACIIIAIISATNSHNNMTEAMAWIIFAIVPDVSSNIYGNAMFSILRLFIMTVIVLLDKEETQKKELIWIFTSHEIILVVAILQIALKVLPVTTQKECPWIKWKSTQPNDVITKDQVPFLLAQGGLARVMDYS